MVKYKIIKGFLIIILLLNTSFINAYNPGNSYKNERQVISTETMMNRTMKILNYSIEGYNPSKSYIADNNLIGDNETLNEEEYLLYTYDILNVNLIKLPENIRIVAMSYLENSIYKGFDFFRIQNLLSTKGFISNYALTQGRESLRYYSGIYEAMNLYSDIGREIIELGGYYGIDDLDTTIISLWDTGVDMSLKDFFIKCDGWKFLNDGSGKIILNDGKIITPKDLLNVHINEMTGKIRFIQVDPDHRQLEIFMAKHRYPDYVPKGTSRLVDSYKIAQWEIKRDEYRSVWKGNFLDPDVKYEEGQGIHYYNMQSRKFRNMEVAAQEEYKSYKTNTLHDTTSTMVKTAFKIGIIGDILINTIVAIAVIILLVRNSKW